MPKAARRPLRTRLLAALAACFVLALAASPVARAAEKGLATDLTWGTSSTDQDRTGTAIADLGARWVRISANWHDVEGSKGHYSTSQLSSIDRAVTVARNAGARIIMFVDHSPGWASGSTDTQAPPQNVGDYANFVRFLAGRYVGRVDAYEVWNEENTSRFWPSGVNAAAYGLLLKAAHGAIKAADPNAKVVFGGVAYNDYGFVEAAFAAAPDLGNYFDVMATHPYTTSSLNPEAVSRTSDGRISMYSFAGYREVRSAMLARGADKPIWFTEFGWSTTSKGNGVDQSTQAAYVTRAFQCMNQDPYVQVGVWYNARNNYWANDADTWEDQTGLMRTDFSHKPSYDAFKGYASGTGSCTYQETGSPAPLPQPGSGTEDPTSPGSGATVTGTTTKKHTSTTLRVRRAAAVAARKAKLARLRSFLLSGRVASVTSGRVVLRFERRSDRDHIYHRALTSSTTLRSGKFTKTVRPSRTGRWRVRAVFAGTSTHAASNSRYVYFTV